jgi:hypothetical protein
MILSPEAIRERCAEDQNGCWNWIGATASGYGRFKQNGKLYSAHREMYSMTFGSDGMDGKQVCHKCDNPKCCNPEHLFLGTRSENMLDCVRKGRHGMKIYGRRSPKYGPELIDSVKEVLATEISINAAAKALGFSRWALVSFIDRHSIKRGDRV